MPKRAMTLALVNGRHNIPNVEGAVFQGAVNPLDVEALESAAQFVLQDCAELNLYVTGLTVALIAALNVANDLGIPVTLWHFNRDTGKYYPQRVRF